MKRRYKHAELTERITGVFYNVYNELGFGFLESVYEEAMALAFKERGINFQRQVSVPIWFHGQKIGSYNADIVVDELVLVEAKGLQNARACS